MYLFDILIDGKLVRGKSFRRWAKKPKCRLDFQTRLVDKSWRQHEHYKEIKQALQSMLMMDVCLGDIPQHPSNGTYIIRGTKELYQETKDNKPPKVVRL